MLAAPILHLACEGGKQRSRRLRRQRNDMRTLNGKFFVIANSKLQKLSHFFISTDDTQKKNAADTPRAVVISLKMVLQVFGSV